MSKRVIVTVEGREYVVEVDDLNESPIKATVNHKTYYVQLPGQGEETSSHTPNTPATRPVPTISSTGSTSITTPMPGTIAEIKVKIGDYVKAGDVVCVLEAMKMKNKIHANRAGVIATIDVAAGQDVDYGAPLVTFE